jgi:hypothetical protein
MSSSPTTLGTREGYLNEVFTWWHRIPKHMNFLKHFWVGDEGELKAIAKLGSLVLSFQLCMSFTI